MKNLLQDFDDSLLKHRTKEFITSRPCFVMKDLIFLTNFRKARISIERIVFQQLSTRKY